MNSMQRIKNFLIILLSLIACVGVGVGTNVALRSSLFTLQKIDVKSTPASEDAPLTEEEIIGMAGLETGKATLFEIDLKSAEQKILSSSLVYSVQIQRKPPNTLEVAVVFREPVALIQFPKGAMAYLDSEGKVFGPFSLLHSPDLPILSGNIFQNSEKIKQALDFISRWESSALVQYASISSVHWDSERGLRIVATYSLISKGSNSRKLANHVRTVIEFGPDLDEHLDEKLVRLSSVFRYLSGNSIAARQVLADIGKKVVVKTARGS